MQSKAATISEYLEELPSDRRAALSELRALIHRVAPRTVEAMQYGLPSFGDLARWPPKEPYGAVCLRERPREVSPRDTRQGELRQGLHSLQAVGRPEPECRGEFVEADSQAAKAGHRAELPIVLCRRRCGEPPPRWAGERLCNLSAIVAAGRAFPAAVAELGCSANDRNKEMREYEIVDANAETIDGCSFCGYKDANNPGHRRKRIG